MSCPVHRKVVNLANLDVVKLEDWNMDLFAKVKKRT